MSLGPAFIIGMDSRNKPLALAAATAKHRLGVVSADQLLQCGLSHRAIRRSVESGILVDLFPNVYHFAGAPLTFEGKMYGATMWGGAGAASYRAAARIQGLSIKSDVVEITIPRRTRAPNGIKVHYDSIDPKDIVRVGLIPVTSVSLTLLRLGAVVPSTLVQSLMDESIIKEKATKQALFDVLLREGGKGNAGEKTFRRLLSQIMALPDAVKSELERLLARIFIDESLPTPVAQHELLLAGRRVVPDFSYPELRIAVEADGYEVHRDRRQWEEDMRRWNLLILNGWIVLRHSWSMINNEPKLVAEDIRNAIALRQAVRG